MNRLLYFTVCFLFIKSSVFSHDDEPSLPFEHPYPVGWYQKSLEASMQIWGDLDMLARGKNDMLPDHYQLVIDSAVGRLVYLDWCLTRLAQESHGPIKSEDVPYLIRIVFALEDIYQQALEQDTTGRIESAQPIFRNVRERMNQIIRQPELLETDHALATPGQKQSGGTNLFNPIQSFWYCGCRIV